MNNNNLQKYVCSTCAGNTEIKRSIFLEEKENETTKKCKCSYCEKKRLCISIDSLAKAVDEIYRTDYEPYESGSYPSEIISEMLQLDHAAGKLDFDLVDILSNEELSSKDGFNNPMYDAGMTYGSYGEINMKINDGSEHKASWNFFCYQIKHQTRFFNNEVIKLLNRIFVGIKEFNYKDGISPIRTIQPTDDDAVFYRARHAANANERIKICCNPTQELGPPPAYLTNSGRMNPIGISVFYAAYERETCIAEIRLPVGETAITGQFRIEKPITIFDLTVFDNLDSEKSISDDFIAIMGDEATDSLEDKIAFLQKFSAEISKPIPPHKEILDYMPTQALVEYLANHYVPNIDAVVYPSTQTNGTGINIVFLKHKEEVISNSQRFKRLLNGQYQAKWLHEKYIIKPPIDSKLCQSNDNFNNFMRRCSDDYYEQWQEHVSVNFENKENYEDYGDEYLLFVEGSLKVHKINKIIYEDESYDIEFFRY